MKKTSLLMVIVLLLALFPVLNPPIYFVSFCFIVFMYVALAESWNLIGGFTGYLSFGHAAFWGVGAYTTGLLLSKLGFGYSLAVVVGGFVAAALSIVVGYPCLRLRGPYFAAVTLCLAYVIQLIIMNVSFTQGPTGLWLKSLNMDIKTNRVIFYETMLGVMAVIIAITRSIEGSKFGLGLISIREDEDVAQTLRINATRLKMIAFALSAFFPGIVGGIFAIYLSYITPEIVFNVNISILLVLMTLFGGRGTWQGPVIGAVTLTLVNEMLTHYIGAEVARIIYGMLFIAVILFMPDGVMFYCQNLRWRRRAPSAVSQSA
jgi:branched-chain amino acid transport system permease protein